jgi:hypothetical protein
MIVGRVRTSGISVVDWICLMGDSNWLKFGWVGYIRLWRGAMLLEPDEGRTYPVGWICPTWTT